MFVCVCVCVCMCLYDCFLVDASYFYLKAHNLWFSPFMMLATIDDHCLDPLEVENGGLLILFFCLLLAGIHL